MSEPTASSEPTDSSIGTPASPAFVRRRAIFIGLMLLFAIWLGALIAMSVQLHTRR